MNSKFSDTLLKLMQEQGISEAELYRKAGLPQATLNRLLIGATPDPRISTLLPLAKFFKISLEQLIGVAPLSSVQLGEKHTLIPIIPWEKASNWEQTLKDIRAENWPSWHAVSGIEDPSNMFALEIQQKTLGAPFNPGVILAIDPKTPPQDDDFVVVYQKDTKSVALKHLVIDGNTMWLEAPVNKTIQAILLDDNYDICGVVAQATLPFKK